jgi:hypothetical protein
MDGVTDVDVIGTKEFDALLRHGDGEERRYPTI